MPGENVFQPVADSIEKDKVLSDLVRYSSEIKIKTLEPKSDVSSVSPRSINGAVVLCKIVGAPIHETQEHEVIAQFHIGEQKYICQVKARANTDFIDLDFSAPLYRVQRREDFRLRLPGSFQGTLKLSRGSENASCKLSDISAGGCRVEMPKKFSVKMDEVLPGVLSVSKRDDLNVKVNVRHVAPHPDREGSQLVGLQFVEQTEIVKNRMAALVMDLYREFFTKRA